MNARLFTRNLRRRKTRAFDWHCVRCGTGMDIAAGRHFAIDTEHGYQRYRSLPLPA